MKQVKVKVDKFIHDTGKAILIRVRESEHWIPKKLCRKITINKKLRGSVQIPEFFAKKLGMVVEDLEVTMEVVHHIPEPIEQKQSYDEELFK